MAVFIMSRSSPNEQQSSPAATTIAEVLLSSELLERLPDATVVVDRDGVIVQVNSQTQELFGYDRDELIGQKVEILVPESYRDRKSTRLNSSHRCISYAV